MATHASPLQAMLIGICRSAGACRVLKVRLNPSEAVHSEPLAGACRVLKVRLNPQAVDVFIHEVRTILMGRMSSFTVLI